jgi:general stress protein 26
MKKVLKFKFEEKEGFLSVVEKNDYIYALVQKDTPKVKEIEKTHELLLSYELKQPEYKIVKLNVSYDEQLIKEVYHQLEADKNLYFKELDDSLCVLEIPKA